MKHYDIGIIGGGVAGAFAVLRIAEHHKNTKAILFELGRPPQKRRRMLEGWFGCFPTGDGKIYINDVEDVLDIADKRHTKVINKWFLDKISSIEKSKIIKNKQPSNDIQKKIKNLGFGLKLKDYIQWNPENIHQLSKTIAEKIENLNNITFSFDNEVYSFLKNGNEFIVSTAEGEFRCKKILLCSGRSGWRWINKLYRDFGILQDDNTAMYGIRLELAAQYMKEFNKSHCVLSRNDLKIGPLSWSGSVIQEDHADLTISSFRSNEDRWKSDKVIFSLIGLKEFKDQGCKQTDRLGKLAFLLAGDRVGREKIKIFMRNESQLNLIPEYNWLSPIIEELDQVFPSLIGRGYFHYPDILTTMSKIKLGNNLESEIDGLYVAGENAGLYGIGAAAITGGLAIEGALK